jgi:hypothetical protein
MVPLSAKALRCRRECGSLMIGSRARCAVHASTFSARCRVSRNHFTIPRPGTSAPTTWFIYAGLHKWSASVPNSGRKGETSKPDLKVFWYTGVTTCQVEHSKLVSPFCQNRVSVDHRWLGPNRRCC